MTSIPESKKRKADDASDEPRAKRQMMYKHLEFPSERDNNHNFMISVKDGVICVPEALILMCGDSTTRPSGKQNNSGINVYIDTVEGSYPYKDENREDVNEFFNAVFHYIENLEAWVSTGDLKRKVAAVAVAKRRELSFGEKLGEAVVDAVFECEKLDLDLLRKLVASGCSPANIVEKYVLNLTGHNTRPELTWQEERNHEWFWKLVLAKGTHSVAVPVIISEYIAKTQNIDPAYLKKVADIIVKKFVKNLTTSEKPPFTFGPDSGSSINTMFGGACTEGSVPKLREAICEHLLLH